MSSAKSGYSDTSTEPTKQIQGQVTFLMGDYERLCKDAKLKDECFDSLESRVDSLETRVDSLETRVDSLDTKLSSMDSKLDSVLKALGKQTVIDRSPIETPRRDPAFA